MNRFIDKAQPIQPRVICTNKNGVTMDCSVIPDLWNIAEQLPTDQQDAVIHVWGKAHTMRDQLALLASVPQDVTLTINQDGELRVLHGENTLVKFDRSISLRLRSLLSMTEFN